MDNGIWATWYDLDDGERDAHLAWLHREYLPWLRQRPGFAWVAHYANEGGGHAMRDLGNMLVRPGDEVPRGGQFLLLAGAPSPHAFFAKGILTDAGPFASQLAQRRNMLRAIFVEEARVDGPESGTRPAGGPPGPAIQMGAFRISSVEEEFRLGAWYAQYRLPSIARTPGAIGARKLISVAGWPKNAILYEFVSLAARLEHFELPQEKLALDPNEWTGKVVRTTIHIPGSPVIGSRSWPPLEAR
jgi:hypothetical protein